jgi:hypothetical protein
VVEALGHVGLEALGLPARLLLGGSGLLLDLALKPGLECLQALLGLGAGV